MKDRPKQMSALCIAQPWATCIFEHGKNVENRSANLKKRGTIAIYISRSNVRWRFEVCQEEYGVTVESDDVPKGVVLGFVDVVDVIEDGDETRKTKKWFQPGGYGYVLDNLVILKNPVSAKPPNGAVKFWHLKGRVLEKCLDQVSGRRLAEFKPWEDA